MTVKYLPKHATLVDPFSGGPLTAIGFKRNGAPIWPVIGGSQPTGEPPADPTPGPTPVPAPPPAPTPPAPDTPPATGGPKHAADPTPDDGLGDAGKRALAAERDARKAADDARKAAEKNAADLTAKLEKLAPLERLAEALGGGDATKGKTEMELLGERLAAQEQALAEQRKLTDDERLLRIRLEVATDKGLTKAQAARLVGTTAEELAADADALLALFPKASAPAAGDPPATEPTKPAPPKPDPSQGARGEAPTRSTSLAGAIGAAMAPPAK